MSTAKSAAETVLNSNIYTVMDAATYVSSWAQKKNPNSIFEGHRWDDLMRTQSTIKAYGTLMELLDTYAYPNNVFAYPIPADEINANSNIEQNQGY